MISEIRSYLHDKVEAKYGAGQGYIFFRCGSCASVITAKSIITNGKCSCAGSKFSPTDLRIHEEIPYIVGAFL